MPRHYSVPERWIGCPRVGKVVQGTSFLPFKVPLDSRYNSQIPDEHRWTPEMLADRYKDLGLVIDLTKSARYYDPNLFPPSRVTVTKIPCAGRGSTPTPEQTQTFIRICDMYLQKNPGKLIGVHCTHGFNRTGFLICAFMYDKLDVAIEDAIVIFKQARPPGIYKDHYIEDLCERYDGLTEGLLPAPVPEWSAPDAAQRQCVQELVAYLDSIGDKAVEGEELKKVEQLLQQCLQAAVDSTVSEAAETHGWRGFKFADNRVQSAKKLADTLRNDVLAEKWEEVAEEDLADGEPPVKKVKKGPSPKDENCESEEAAASGNPFCIPGGEIIDAPHLGPLRKICREMVGAKEGTAFPGAQPVSLLRSHLEMIGTRPTVVSWKADGTRYLLLILGQRGSYMIGRDNSFYKVNLFFPSRKDPAKLLDNTLLDGEMVTDVVKDAHGKQHKRPRFLIFDMITFDGEGFHSKDYKVRLEAAKIEVVQPRDALRGKHDFSNEPCGVHMKPFWPLRDLDSPEFKATLAKLTHEEDGLILAIRDEPYKAGTNQSILKWKRPELNSIDFLFKCERRGDAAVATLLVSYPNGTMQPFRDTGKWEIRMADPQGAEMLMSLDGKIVECVWLMKERQWKYLRVRDDKTQPNFYTTAYKVYQSIREGVTYEDLQNIASRLRFQAQREKTAHLTPVQARAKECLSHFVGMRKHLEKRMSAGKTAVIPLEQLKNNTRLVDAVRGLLALYSPLDQAFASAGWTAGQFTHELDMATVKMLERAVTPLAPQSSSSSASSAS